MSGLRVTKSVTFEVTSKDTNTKVRVVTGELGAADVTLTVNGKVFDLGGGGMAVLAELEAVVAEAIRRVKDERLPRTEASR